MNLPWLSALFEIADSEFEDIKNLVAKEEKKGAEASDKFKIDSELDNSAEQETDLNIYSFKGFLSNEFKEEFYESSALEKLFSEIIKLNKDISLSKFKNSIKTHKNTIIDYSKNTENESLKFSRLTEVRHMLYLSDKKVFEKLIYKNLIDKLDKYLKKDKS